MKASRPVCPSARDPGPTTQAQGVDSLSTEWGILVCQKKTRYSPDPDQWDRIPAFLRHKRVNDGVIKGLIAELTDLPEGVQPSAEAQLVGELLATGAIKPEEYVDPTFRKRGVVVHSHGTQNQKENR